ncbi:MAG: hypothetical protein JRD89_03970 [Deltaproteobacteria bacterium]|nr:hypothetical protein [Deltaproteobacteria bacterium]
MFYNFDTDDERAATAALLVYAIYRSRDVKRFKVTPDLWGQTERAVKSVAKRATDLGEFIEKLKPKLYCSTIHPRWAKTLPDGIISMKMMEDGSVIQVQDKGRRQFLTDVLQMVDHREVLDVLYQKASLVILLVRDRLEREKPIEAKFVDTETGEVVE